MEFTQAVLTDDKFEPLDRFHSYHYQRHNQRRLEHLASLGLPIAGASVLEVGAGIGDHTSFFLDRGCSVVSTEARVENLELLRSRYPKISVKQLDLDQPALEFNQQFDIVYCYGVLYHLMSPETAIAFMARNCQRMLLLETCVSFGSGESVNPCEEPAHDPTQSVAGQGCRPHRKWVYRQLQRYFDFVYMPTTQPNHEEFPTDWTVPAVDHPSSLTRAIYIASRQKIENSLLVEGIPTRQVRHP